MENFTPGPWILEFQGIAAKGSIAILTEKGWGHGPEFPWIAQVEGTHVGPASQAEVDANAYLIGAAPDLYAALREVEWNREGFCPQCDRHREDGHQQLCAVGLALAKSLPVEVSQ